jgi:predicted dehydrogenase
MIRTGIVGLGKMGLSHFAIFNAHPDVEVTALCDPSPLVRVLVEKYARKKCYPDFRTMSSESRLDCVVIATPTKFHAETVRSALENDLHVFCEKPLGLTRVESEELASLAEKRGRVTQVGYHCRYTGVFQKAREWLDRKVLGDIYHFHMEVYGNVVKKEQGSTWRSQRSEGGGCLYDYAAHGIDLVHYLIGNTRRVRGTVLKRIYSRELEDAVYSTLECGEGVSGLLSVNWCDPTYRKMANQITIEGTNGKLVADRQEARLFLRSPEGFPDLVKGWNMVYTTDVTKPVWYYLRGEEYSFQADHFVSRIKDPALPAISTFRTALATDAAIELLTQDAKGGA